MPSNRPVPSGSAGGRCLTYHCRHCRRGHCAAGSCRCAAATARRAPLASSSVSTASRLSLDPTAGNPVADRCGNFFSHPLLTETLSHFHAYKYFRGTTFESADLSLQLVFKGPTHADIPNKLRTSLLATALLSSWENNLEVGG